MLVLDGEAIWSRATQETSNRLIAAVGSLLDGSRPSCFPIENQQLAQWSRATQETSNRRDEAVGSLLCGSRPSCFPIENQHLAQWFESLLYGS